MYFIVSILAFCYHFCLNHGENFASSVAPVASVDDVADALVNLLCGECRTNTTRIQELKDKLSRIDSYVVNKNQYAELLHNKTKQTELNETNFYTALQENDHYMLRNLTDKNLYLKLKEKMNRDDLMKILASRGEERVMKSARRMVDENFVAKRRREMSLNEAVDKYLGEVPTDNHNYHNDYEKYSKYWDPQPELEERLRSQKDGRRLFKGERTTIVYYPFMTSIHVMSRFWCGGVLYWHDLVITSASCLQLLYNNRFYRENPKVLAVRFGSNHSRVGGEEMPALEVYFHPSYLPRTLENNIALIRLRRHIHFSYHRNPKIIQISHQENALPFTSEVMLLGWGVSKTTQKLSYEPLFLQKKTLPVYPNKFCQEIYGEKFITRTMFCAGTVSTGEGACAHDAGGPAIMNGVLVGIISYGPSVCGIPDSPTVFTHVGAFADWIETVNETMPDYQRGRARTTSTTEDPVARLIHGHSTKRTGHTINPQYIGIMSMAHVLSETPHHLLLNFDDIKNLNDEQLAELEDLNTKNYNSSSSDSSISVSSGSSSGGDYYKRIRHSHKKKRKHKKNKKHGKNKPILRGRDKVNALIDAIISAKNTDTSSKTPDLQPVLSTLSYNYNEAPQNDNEYEGAYDAMIAPLNNSPNANPAGPHNNLKAQSNLNAQKKVTHKQSSDEEYTALRNSDLERQEASFPPKEIKNKQHLAKSPKIDKAENLHQAEIENVMQESLAEVSKLVNNIPLTFQQNGVVLSQSVNRAEPQGDHPDQMASHNEMETNHYNLGDLSHITPAVEFDQDKIQHNLERQYELGTGQVPITGLQLMDKASNDVNEAQWYDSTTHAHQWAATEMGSVEPEAQEYEQLSIEPNPSNQNPSMSNPSYNPPESNGNHPNQNIDQPISHQLPIMSVINPPLSNINPPTSNDSPLTSNDRPLTSNRNKRFELKPRKTTKVYHADVNLDESSSDF